MKYHEIQSNTIHYHAMQCSAMKYFAIPCNRFNYNTIFCPKKCPFGGPSSAVEFVEEAGARDMDTAQPDGSASGSWAQIRPLGAAKGPPGPPKGRFWAKTDPFGGPRSSVEVSEGAQAHGMDAAHPAGPTSGSWAKNRPTGPSEDL